MKMIITLAMALASTSSFAVDSEWKRIDCQLNQWVHGKKITLQSIRGVYFGGGSVTFARTKYSDLSFYIDETYPNNPDVCVKLETEKTASCTSADHSFIEIGYNDSELGFVAASCIPHSGND